MTDESTRDCSRVDRFDDNATAYVDNPVHRSGSDLETLADWCIDAERVLDIATGVGHTAGAIARRGSSQVIAVDAAPRMVNTAEREFPSVNGVISDAERLPFRNDSFDAVACRIAAHHFPNPDGFVREVARILKPGGTFAFEDNIAPEDDRLDLFLNRIERLRDPTHVRSHRESEWRSRIANAGLVIEESSIVKKTIDYEDWLTQLDTPEDNRRKIEETFRNPPNGSIDLYEIDESDGNVESFANLKLLLRATR